MSYCPKTDQTPMHTCARFANRFKVFSCQFWASRFSKSNNPSRFSKTEKHTISVFDYQGISDNNPIRFLNNIPVRFLTPCYSVVAVPYHHPLSGWLRPPPVGDLAFRAKIANPSRATHSHLSHPVSGSVNTEFHWTPGTILSRIH